MQGVAADRIDGRFAQDARLARVLRQGKAAQILAGSRSHPPPRAGGGAAQFGADGLILGVAQEEDGIDAPVGIEAGVVEQRFQQCRGQATFRDQIMADPGEVLRGRRRQDQQRSRG